MLREYRLTNFKAFGETVTIPIRPLTLIFGANSSGKSSIFQSLLLLKQTLEEAKNPNTALLPKGSLVDLGAYSDFVHGHNTALNFEVGALFDDAEDANLNIEFHYDKKLKNPGQVITLRGYNNQNRDEERPAISWSLKLFERNDKKAFETIVKPAKEELDKEIAEYARSALRKLVSVDRATAEEALVELDKTYDLKYEVLWAKESELVGADKRSFGMLQVDFGPDSARRWWDKIKKSLAAEFVGKAYFVDFDGKEYNPEDFFQDSLDDYPLDRIVQSLKTGIIFDLHRTNFLPTNIKGLSEFLGIPKEDDILRAQWHGWAIWQTEGNDYWEEGESYSQHLGTYVLPAMFLPVCSKFSDVLKNLLYLGPLRSQPERYYTFSGDTTDYVGQSGEYLSSLLFKDQELVEQINIALERLGVKYQVKLSKLQYEDASPSNVFSLRLVDTETKTDASLRDVGFGISQVLPIIVQNRLSEKKTLLIEQPEIHLHPAHQAELGDMFIRSALGEQKNTLLLETHSENLILRILRRIRETNDNELPEGFPPIYPKDVAVLYVQPGENGAQVIEIPVTEDGDFAHPWPQGFFEESVKELF